MTDPVAESRERLSEFVAMRGGWMGDEDGPDYREFLRLRDSLIAAVRWAALEAAAAVAEAEASRSMTAPTYSATHASLRIAAAIRQLAEEGK